jgi:SAM-dependent methyltransferase
MGFETVIDSDYAHAVDARLASYDAYIEYQVQEAHRAVPFLSRFFSIQDARALEIGTGRGGKGIAYAKEGMQVTALDVDLPSLELGEHAARSRGASIHFLAGDGAVLPFPPEHFDAILLDSVIEHVRDPQSLLRECKRVLKRGGIVFIVFPPYYGPLSGHIDDYIMIPWFHLLPRRIVRQTLLARPPRAGILTPRDAFEVYTTLNGLTVRAFKRWARRSGFAFDYFRVRPFLTHPGMRLAAGLASAIKRPPRGRNLYVVFSRALREFDLGTWLLFLLLSAISPLAFVPIVQEMAAGGCKAVLRKPL